LLSDVFKIFANDLEDVQILLVSLNATVDILTIYGLSLVEKRDEEEMSGSRCEEEMSSSRCEEERKVFVGGTSLTDLIQALADHLEHEVRPVLFFRSTENGKCYIFIF
jgi:hypothetical protein